MVHNNMTNCTMHIILYIVLKQPNLEKEYKFYLITPIDSYFIFTKMI